MSFLKFHDEKHEYAKYDYAKKHWEVLAYFRYPDGTRELIQEISHNVVVQNVSVIIAALMKAHPGYGGLLYWAVGSGLQTWSSDDPPLPLDTDYALANETYRKAISSSNIAFIDLSNNVSATPTNRLQATVVFGTSEANGKLMEFGLFGGNATGVKNSGLMINHKIHPLITKTDIVELEYMIRLTF